MSHFEITLNGERVTVTGVAPTTTLLEWLRSTGRTGSKRGCDEGDCGACSVSIVERDANGKATYRAINSCIALLPMFAGREIITVEGLGCGKALHPVQTAMVENYGSQCGYCTPGFILSMFEGYYREDATTPAKINDQLCGNLCRCTGYRPIRDAALEVFGRERPADDAFAQRLARPVEPLRAFDYEAAAEKFSRPGSMAELLRLKAENPDAPLVAGATEIGVELNKKFKKFPHLISTEGVAEITAIKRAADGTWHIGAAATLTAIEEKLGDECPPFAKMLRLFAARQIRNRATLGGNLATASPIGDSAPVLMAFDASVVLASASGERTVALADFFTGYRQTVMLADEVIREIVLPPAGAPTGMSRRADFVKVSHRVELDISIVAAAFRIDTDGSGIVRAARLVYGGVAERTKRATAAETLLVGNRLEEVLPAVTAKLREEFTPIDDTRSGAHYRRELVVSLFEKFVAHESSEVHRHEPGYQFSGAWPVDDATRALRHESAVGHVTGRALYVDDTAQQRRMLDVWLVIAPHARARIRRRDVSKAWAAPGVVTVLLAEDIPGENNVGVSRHDEPMFATEEVLYHGQVIAAVVGESLKACRAAAALVEIEYEPLEPLLGIKAAVARGSFHTDPHTLKRGDCEQALADAPQRFDGEIEFGGQEHFYLETHASWAEPGEGNTITIHSSTQHPSEIQTIVHEVLDEAKSNIVIVAPRMGGGFGGKETQGNLFACIVALAARKTGRPVRLQLDRDVDMQITGKRHPFHARFSVAHDGEGVLRAARIELISDGGWSLDLSQPIIDRALFHLDNAYYIPAVNFSGRVAKTNTCSNTAFRGFGGPQGMLVIEEILDRVARRLGLPPELVRERNLYRGSGESNKTHYLEDVGDNRLQEIWRKVMEASQFQERKSQIAAWNAAHPRVKRGLAVTPVKFGISFTLTHYNQAGALVNIYTDGTVQVNHGGTEMGQGLHTKMQGVAMRELGLPAERVRVMQTSTDKVPNTSATAASSGADLNGMAVSNACSILRERLRPIAVKCLTIKSGRPDFVPAIASIEFQAGEVFSTTDPKVRVPFGDVAMKAYVERVGLSATGYYATPDIAWDWSKAAGRPFHYFACGAAVSEVEVDGYTGMYRVLRVDIVHDVGDSLNPGVDRGQIEGGFVQGMGWLTSEELKWDAKGRLLTHSASTYQIPGISDTPMEFNVTLLPRATQPGTIHGSKAVGEPPLMLALSVREALRDAVANFGKNGDEVRLASPATGEAVFAAIQEIRK